MPKVKTRPQTGLDAAKRIVADARREQQEIGEIVKRLDMLNRVMSQVETEIVELKANLHLMYGSRGGQPSVERLDELAADAKREQRQSWLTSPNELDYDIPF